MATTMKTISDRAPMPLYRKLLDSAIRRAPLLGVLRGEATTYDEIAYRRRRGTATAPHFNPAGAFADGTDEAFDPLVARIRPFGGAVAEPVIGKGHGDAMEALEAKVIACGKQFLDSAINGQYLDTVTWTPGGAVPPGGINSVVIGPNQDSLVRGGGGMLRLNVAGAVRTLQYLAVGDTAWGTATADLAALIATDVVVRSANPNLWITCNVTGGALGGAAAVYHLAYTSSTNAFDGMLTLCPTTQYSSVVSGGIGATLDFAHLDAIRDMMPTAGEKVAVCAERDFRNLLAAARGTGNFNLEKVSELGDVYRYRGMLVFAQPGMPTNRTVSGVGSCSPLIGFDADYGVKMLYKSNIENPMSLDEDVLRALPGALASWGGLSVRYWGEERLRDDQVTKAIWYASICHLDTQGLAVLDGFVA